MEDKLITDNTITATEDITADTQPAAADIPDVHWYVVHTYSGYENKVKRDIERMAVTKGWWGNLIQDVSVPEETVVEHDNKPLKKSTSRRTKKGATDELNEDESDRSVRKGAGEQHRQPKTYQRKIYPGYVMVKMHINDETWYFVRNTRGVTGFVGTGNTPVPLTDEEVVKMQIEQIQIEMDLEVGDIVAILHDEFGGLTGTVMELYPEDNQVLVRVKFMNRYVETRIEAFKVSKI